MSIDTKRELDNAFNARVEKLNGLLESIGPQILNFSTKGLLVKSWKGVDVFSKLPNTYNTMIGELIAPYILNDQEGWTRPGKVLLYEKLGTEKIAGNAFTSQKIFNGSVTTPKIDYQAFTTSKIATEAVDEDVIADGAFTTVKIADGSITPENFAKDAINLENLEGNFNCNVVFFTKTITLNNNNNAFTINFTPNTPFPKENIILFAHVKLTLSRLPDDLGIATKPLIKNDGIELLASATELYAPCDDTYYYVWERFLAAHYFSQTGRVTVNFEINAKENTVISFSVYIYPEFASEDVFTEHTESLKTKRIVIQEQEDRDGKEIKYQHYSSNLSGEPTQSVYQEKSNLPGGKTRYVVVSRSERPDKTIKTATRFIQSTDGQLVEYDVTREKEKPLKKTTTHTRYNALTLVSKQVVVDILGNKLEQEINTNLQQQTHTINIIGTKKDQNQQEVPTLQANLNINQQGEVSGEINQLEVEGEIDDTGLNIHSKDEKKQINSVYQKDDKRMLHTTRIKDEDEKSEIKTEERQKGSEEGDDFHSAEKKYNDIINMTKFVQKGVKTAQNVITTQTKTQIDDKTDKIADLIDDAVKLQTDVIKEDTEALIIKIQDEQKEEIEKINTSIKKVKKQLTKKVEDKTKSIELQLKEEKIAQQQKNNEVKTVISNIDKKLVASTEAQNKINEDINRIQEQQESLQDNLGDIDTQINNLTTTIQSIARDNPQQTQRAIQTALENFRNDELAELDRKLALAISESNNVEREKVTAQITALQKDIEKSAENLNISIGKYGASFDLIKTALSAKLDKQKAKIKVLNDLQATLKKEMLTNIQNQEKKNKQLEDKIRATKEIIDRKVERIDGKIDRKEQAIMSRISQETTKNTLQNLETMLRISKAEGEIQNNKEDIETANKKIKDLEADIKTQETKIEDAKNKLEEKIHEEAKKITESEQAKIENAKKGLEAKNKKLETKMQKLEKQQQTDEQKIKADENKINKIENDVNALKEKDTQFTKYKNSVEERVEKLKQIASEKVKGIKDIVSTMQKMAGEIDAIQSLYFDTLTVESVFPYLSGTEELKIYQEKIKGEIEEIQIGKRTKNIITEAKVQNKDDPNKVVLEMPTLEIPCLIKALRLEERLAREVYFYYSDAYLKEHLKDTAYTVMKLGEDHYDLFTEEQQEEEQQRHDKKCFGRYFSEKDVRYTVKVPTREEDKKKRRLNLSIAFKKLAKKEGKEILKEIEANNLFYSFKYKKEKRGTKVAPTPVLWTHIFYYDLEAEDKKQGEVVRDIVRALRGVKAETQPKIYSLINEDEEYKKEKTKMKQVVKDSFRKFKYDYTTATKSEYVKGKKVFVTTVIVYPIACLMYPFVDERCSVKLADRKGILLGLREKLVGFLEMWGSSSLEERPQKIKSFLRIDNIIRDYFNDNVLLCTDIGGNYYISRVLNSRFWGTHVGRPKISPSQEQEYLFDIANFARRKVPEFAFAGGRFGKAGYYWCNLLRFDDDYEIPCIQLPSEMGGDASEKVFVDQQLRQDRPRYEDFNLIDRRAVSVAMSAEIFIKGSDAGNANARPQTWVEAKCLLKLFVTT